MHSDASKQMKRRKVCVMKRVEGSPCCPDIEGLLNPYLFKALGDPNRILLLARLAQCRIPCSVSQIAECCPVDLSVVSRHLATLRDAGILKGQKRGKEVHYSVRYPDLVRTLRGIADAIEACCPEADAGRGDHE